MELKVNIEFDELLKILKQLQPRELIELKNAIEDVLADRKTNVVDKTEFKKFLLGGPVMSDERYQEYLENLSPYKNQIQKR